jgi:rhodanese-related sulfurtransferase
MKILNKIVLFFAIAMLLACQSNISTINRSIDQELIEGINDLNHTIDLSEILESPDDFMVIDIRDRLMYDQDHIQGAIHIPLPELIHNEHVKSVEPNEITKVIVGSDYAEAHSAWMVLKTMGINDIYVLTEGDVEEMIADIAVYDYKSMINKLLEEGMKANESLPVTVPPKPKPRPKKKKVVEEEGC